MSGGRSPGAPDLAQLVAELSSAVTSHLNDTSRAHGLESLLTRLSTLEVLPVVWGIAATEEGTPDGTLAGATTTTGGLTWTGALLGTTSLRRLSGRIVPALSEAVGVHVVNLGATDAMIVAMGRATAANSLWLYGRYSTSGAATGILLERNVNGVNLSTQVNGATVQIKSAPVALSGSDERITLSCIGTTVQGLVNGVPIVTAQTTVGQGQAGWGVRLQGNGTTYVERLDFIKKVVDY